MGVLPLVAHLYFRRLKAKQKQLQVAKIQTIFIASIVSISYLQNSYNHTKEANGAAEDFHDEDLDEQAGILGVRQCRSATHDADADATEEVGEAHGQARSKHGITWTEDTDLEMNSIWTRGLSDASKRSW